MAEQVRVGVRLRDYVPPHADVGDALRGVGLEVEVPPVGRRGELVLDALPRGEVGGVLVPVLPDGPPRGEHGERRGGADLVGGGGAAGEDAAQHEPVRGGAEGVELRGDVRGRVDDRQQREGRGGAHQARVLAGDLDQRLVVGVGMEEVAAGARIRVARVWVRRVGRFGEGGGREEGIHGGDGGGRRRGDLRHPGILFPRFRFLGNFFLFNFTVHLYIAPGRRSPVVFLELYLSPLPRRSGCGGGGRPRRTRVTASWDPPGDVIDGPDCQLVRCF